MNNIKLTETELDVLIRTISKITLNEIALNDCVPMRDALVVLKHQLRQLEEERTGESND